VEKKGKRTMWFRNWETKETNENDNTLWFFIFINPIKILKKKFFFSIDWVKAKRKNKKFS